MIKLNVGCGNKILSKEQGWINIDGNANPGVDLVLDLSNTHLPYPDNSVDYILAENILEHISRHKQEEFLSELVRVLKCGGRITLEMPHLQTIVERYIGLRGEELIIDAKELASRFYGSQEDDFGCHRWIYQEEELLELLGKVGLHCNYIGEIRDFNLICDAIKSNADTTDGAFLSCIQTIIDTKTNYYVVDVFNDISKALLSLAIRLSEIGVVFLLTSKVHFDKDSIVNVPDDVAIIMDMIKRSSGFVANDKSTIKVLDLNIPFLYIDNLNDNITLDDCISLLGINV
jgi:predicted SAM-dependent methyltransferase